MTLEPMVTFLSSRNIHHLDSARLFCEVISEEISSFVKTLETAVNVFVLTYVLPDLMEVSPLSFSDIPTDVMSKD